MLSNEQMISSLEGLLKIDSVTRRGEGGKPFGIGCDQALEYVLKLCADLGMKTKNCGGMTGYAEVGEGEELVGILGHLDVMPAGKGWDYPAFGLTRTGGKLYGRGVCDDKGPTLACIYAMKDLMDSGIAVNKRFRLIFGMTEEGGEWTDFKHYLATEECPDYGFTPDGDFPVVNGEKGIVYYDILMPAEKAGFLALEAGDAPNIVPDYCNASVRSADGTAELATTGRAAHGSLPQYGENAISKLMALAAERSDVETPYLAEVYNQIFGFDIHGERVDLALQDDVSGQLTLNVGMIRKENEDFCISVDIRYPVTYTFEEIDRRFRSVVEPKGFRVRIQEVEKQAPVFMAADDPMIVALLEAYRGCTGDRKTPPVVLGGGTYARAMKRVVAFGPNMPGTVSTEHQANENLDEDVFLQLREIYLQALKNLLAAGPLK